MFLANPCIFSIFHNSLSISILYILYILYYIYCTIKYIQFAPSVLHVFLRYIVLISNCPHMHTSGRWHENPPPCPNSPNEFPNARYCLCIRIKLYKPYDGRRKGEFEGYIPGEKSRRAEGGAVEGEVVGECLFCVYIPHSRIWMWKSSIIPWGKP